MMKTGLHFVGFRNKGSFVGDAKAVKSFAMLIRITLLMPEDRNHSRHNI